MLETPELPPLVGMVTVIADDDAMFDGSAAHYVHVGLSAAQIILRALQGRPAPSRILDLPCGHGRVTRVLRALYPLAAITVCDLDRSGVDFASVQFGARGIYSKHDFRELELNEEYDLIWVGSLITHLPEAQTRRFLDFVGRHLSHDGTLVVTSHGAFVTERLRSWNYGLPDDAARAVLADATMYGYGYRSYSGGEGYGISVVSPLWFGALLSDGPLQLDAYEARAWDDHQDVLVIRRNLAARLDTACEDTYAAGAHDCPPAEQQAKRDAIAVSGFDEDWYLAAHPLVAKAVIDGTFASGFGHYREYGWKEGRRVCDPSLTYEAQRARATANSDRISQEAFGLSTAALSFDEKWYVDAYPDVKAALEAGTFSSAWEHYSHFGRAEGRQLSASDVPQLPR